jgi:hypothetical protein
MKKKIIVGIYIFIAIIILSVSVFSITKIYNWYYGVKTVISKTTFAPAIDNKKARKITKEKITAKVPIEVFNKEEISKQLKIQDPDKSNPNIEFTDAKTIPSSDNDTSVIARWDKEQGNITIEARQEPLSAIVFNNKWEAYTDIAYTINSELEIASGVSWQCLRVFKVKTELYIEARATNIQTENRNNLTGLIGIRFSKPIFQK